MINFYKHLKKSVISEEVIARDIEEFEKQKHLLNTPVQVNARILLVESICIPWSWLAETENTCSTRQFRWCEDPIGWINTYSMILIGWMDYILELSLIS